MKKLALALATTAALGFAAPALAADTDMSGTKAQTSGTRRADHSPVGADPFSANPDPFNAGPELLQRRLTRRPPRLTTSRRARSAPRQTRRRWRINAAIRPTSRGTIAASSTGTTTPMSSRTKSRSTTARR